MAIQTKQIEGGGGSTPTGVIVGFGGTIASVPADYLPCDGFAYGRTSGDPNPQPALFAVIGTLWGIGDGSTTFNAPDWRGRSPMGLNDGTLPNGSDGGLTSRSLGDVAGSEAVASSASGGAHTHIISGDGGHSHTVASHSHTLPSDTSAISVSVAVGGILGFIGSGPGSTGHDHNLGGSTGSSAPATDSTASHDHGGSTNSTSNHTHSTSVTHPVVACPFIIKT